MLLIELKGYKEGIFCRGKAHFLYQEYTICLVWWNVVHLQIDSGSAGCDAGGAGGVLAAQRAWGATPSQQFY